MTFRQVRGPSSGVSHYTRDTGICTCSLMFEFPNHRSTSASAAVGPPVSIPVAWPMTTHMNRFGSLRRRDGWASVGLLARKSMLPTRAHVPPVRAAQPRWRPAVWLVAVFIRGSAGDSDLAGRATADRVTGRSSTSANYASWIPSAR